MTSIKQWLQLHSPSAQAIASAWALLTLAWATNQQFHDYIKTAFDALPKGIHAFAVGVIIPLCILWRTQRKNVAVAEASEGQGGTAKAEASVGKVAAVLLFGALMVPLSGCRAANSTTPPAALAPGALNQFDQDSYSSLMAAQAALNSLTTSVATDSNLAILKPTLNQAITDYDVAELAWQTYHAAATAANQTAVTNALNTVNADVTNLQKAVK